MYLGEKRIRALETALEAMENHPMASNDPDQNEAMSIIAEMIWAARKERLLRRDKNGRHR